MISHGAYTTTVYHPEATLLLDDYPGAFVAASLRKLSVNYTGFCIRVQRSSDSTTQDIGFDSSGNVDTAAITSFVGSGQGFVTVWYDQSGNGYDFESSVSNRPPEITNSSGTVHTLGGKTTMYFNKDVLHFNGASNGLDVPDTHTLAYVASQPNSIQKYIMGGSGAGSAPAIIAGYAGADSVEQFYNGYSGAQNERNTLTTDGASTTAFHLVGIARDADAATPFTKGYFNGTEAYTDNSIQAALLGNMKTVSSPSTNTTHQPQYYTPEIIFWDEYKSPTDVGNISTDIKTYWGI